MSLALDAAGEGKVIHERKDIKEITWWQTTKRTMDARSMILTSIVVKMEMIEVDNVDRADGTLCHVLLFAEVGGLALYTH